jgi:hypothetical protein
MQSVVFTSSDGNQLKFHRLINRVMSNSLSYFHVHEAMNAKGLLRIRLLAIDVTNPWEVAIHIYARSSEMGSVHP